MSDSRWRLRGRWLLAGLWLVVSCGQALASGAIAQGFAAGSSNIVPGTLVSLGATNKSAVAPATEADAARLVGIASNKPLVELSDSAKAVQVVVSGMVAALVSNINGAVKAGDKIAVSPVAGIGMKATQSSEVVGVAEEDLSSITTVSQSVQASNGKRVNISVGMLPVSVGVSFYSAPVSAGAVSSFVPPILQHIADAVVGRVISPWRVLAAALVMLLGFAMVAVMLETSIRSGIISIGRNPLARGALLRGLIDVIIAALGVLAVTVVGVSVILMS